MRSVVVTLTVIPFLSAGSAAQIALKNGAGIDMLNSPGSQIVFPDGTTLGSVLELVEPADHGGIDNTVGGYGAFIGGGKQNEAQGVMSTLAGGYDNSVLSDYGSVGGGGRNRVLAPYGIVSGGGPIDETALDGNVVFDEYGTIGGGGENVAGLDDEVVENQSFATVGGGRENAATALASTISGGNGNVASGAYSMIPGGQFNSATGSFSFAAGRSAKATHAGSFVWSDDTGTNLSTSASKTFLARASNGFFFYTTGNLSIGAQLPAGESAWETLSDRDAKENLVEVDPEVVLEKLAAMPVMRFNYKGADAAKQHVGVMAQDFHAAFGLGVDPLRISTQDADGVAFAAIKGLNEKLRRELSQRDEELAIMRAEIADLKQRMQD